MSKNGFSKVYGYAYAVSKTLRYAYAVYNSLRSRTNYINKNRRVSSDAYASMFTLN